MSERDDMISYLREAVPRIRAIAASVGTQHTGWDVIGSIEHYTEGKPAYGYEGDAGLWDLVLYVKSHYPASGGR